MTAVDERRPDPADAAELGERLAEVVAAARAARAEELAALEARWEARLAEAGELLAIAYERGYKLAPLARRAQFDRNLIYKWMKKGKT